jgi:hypothetical protein
MIIKRLYDAKIQACHTDTCCPAVDIFGDTISIHHPDRPELGIVKMSVQEYNDMVKNLPIINQ